MVMCGRMIFSKVFAMGESKASMRRGVKGLCWVWRWEGFWRFSIFWV